ncbi:MAG: hypothetical protein HY261_08085 [Chloroflexi bacterium]|nr:hypothetical protein [Chloroflexota bacterium]
MTIVHRRVFFGKVGTADRIVKLCREFEKAARKYGFNIKTTRVMTDYFNGRTDRVAWAWEVDSLAALDAGMNKIMSNSKGKAEFDRLFGQLSQLIDHAEVENWTLQ